MDKIDTEATAKVDKTAGRTADAPKTGPLPGQMGIPGAGVADVPLPGETPAPAEPAAALPAEWVTREEAARLLGKTTRTVDRMRAKGLLKDLEEPGPVRITTESVERYLRRKVEPRPGIPMTTVEAAHYDGLLLQLQRQASQLEQMKTTLITWTGEKEAAAARIAVLEAALEAERKKGFWRRLFGK